MEFKTKLPLLVFLFCLIFLSSLTLGYETEDPQQQYEQCQRRCQQQRRGEPRQLCEHRCEQQLREQQREQEERGGGEGRGGNTHGRDPQKEYQECQRTCEEHERSQRKQCYEQCDRRRREREESRHGGGDNPDWREEEGQQEQQESSPYHFSDQHFRTRIRTSEGQVRVLQKFTQRSDLLRGIENYRVAILEANPNTFIVPNHQDADIVLFVVRGRGSITLVRQDDKETHNLEPGDVMRVPAGNLVYLINRDNNEKLFIAKLLQPVSTPGSVETFFGPGGEDPESFYSSFSNDILEAAFNTPMERLHRLIGQQKRGAIVKASQEQIRALTPHSRWPFGSESSAPYNLLQHRPVFANNYGQLYQVTPKDYSQLQDLDVAVTFANITRGGMAGPYYNTRATKISVVVEGSGHFEMACPHLTSSSGRHGGRGGHEQTTGKYQKVRARLSRGDVIIAPAGHPIAAVASRDQNLQILCFEVNARHNRKNLLVGRGNILNQIEREAKELAFNMKAGEVEEIFNNQKETFFFPGPGQRQEQGRAFE